MTTISSTSTGWWLPRDWSIPEVEGGGWARVPRLQNPVRTTCSPPLRNTILPFAFNAFTLISLLYILYIQEGLTNLYSELLHRNGEDFLDFLYQNIIHMFIVRKKFWVEKSRFSCSRKIYFQVGKDELIAKKWYECTIINRPAGSLLHQTLRRNHSYVCLNLHEKNQICPTAKGGAVLFC